MSAKIYIAEKNLSLDYAAKYYGGKERFRNEISGTIQIDINQFKIVEGATVYNSIETLKAKFLRKYVGLKFLCGIEFNRCQITSVSSSLSSLSRGEASISFVAYEDNSDDSLNIKQYVKSYEMIDDMSVEYSSSNSKGQKQLGRNLSLEINDSVDRFETTDYDGEITYTYTLKKVSQMSANIIKKLEGGPLFKSYLLLMGLPASGIRWINSEKLDLNKLSYSLESLVKYTGDSLGISRDIVNSETYSVNGLIEYEKTISLEKISSDSDDYEDSSSIAQKVKEEVVNFRSNNPNVQLKSITKDVDKYMRSAKITFRWDNSSKYNNNYLYSAEFKKEILDTGEITLTVSGSIEPNKLYDARKYDYLNSNKRTSKYFSDTLYGNLKNQLFTLFDELNETDFNLRLKQVLPTKLFGMNYEIAFSNFNIFDFDSCVKSRTVSIDISPPTEKFEVRQSHSKSIFQKVNDCYGIGKYSVSISISACQDFAGDKKTFLYGEASKLIPAGIDSNCRVLTSKSYSMDDSTCRYSCNLEYDYIQN